MIPEVLGMYSSIVTSLDSMMHADHTVLFRVQQDQQLLHKVLALLAIDVPIFGEALNCDHVPRETLGTEVTKWELSSVADIHAHHARTLARTQLRTYTRTHAGKQAG